jgi:hypothetical protein
MSGLWDMSLWVWDMMGLPRRAGRVAGTCSTCGRTLGIQEILDAWDPGLDPTDPLEKRRLYCPDQEDCRAAQRIQELRHPELRPLTRLQLVDLLKRAQTLFPPMEEGGDPEWICVLKQNVAEALHAEEHAIVPAHDALSE